MTVYGYDQGKSHGGFGSSNGNGSGGSGSGPQADTYHERDDQWAAFTTALQPVTRTFGPALGPRLATLLVDVAVAQVGASTRPYLFPT